MGHNSNSHYFHELRRAKLDFVFRAYVRHHGESWADRYTLLCRLADGCGDHRTWSEIVYPDGERQEWIVWAFKRHQHKLSLRGWRAADPGKRVHPAGNEAIAGGLLK